MLFSSPLSDLLPLVPLSAHTILDAACGDGGLAAAYRPLNPRARLLGIDRDPAAVALAVRHMDQVATADLATDPLPFDLPDGLDCIVYDGLLQHLRDPWNLLHRHAEMLNPDGMMLISVPNIAYWRHIEQILRGAGPDLDADDHAGERPHRFSLEGLRQAFVRLGLTVCDVTPREPDAEAAARFATTLGAGLDALGIDSRDFARRGAASHLIWRVRKEPRQRIILSGSMLDPVGGVSHLRVVIRCRRSEPTRLSSPR